MWFQNDAFNKPRVNLKLKITKNFHVHLGNTLVCRNYKNLHIGYFIAFNSVYIRLACILVTISMFIQPNQH